MKRIVFLLVLNFYYSTYAQNQEKKKSYLIDYAICDCLTQGYHKVGIKLNDRSINYWFDSSFLTKKQYELFDDFIASYVKKMELNQGYDGSTCVINYCLSIKEDKEFIKLKLKLLKK